MRTLLLAAIIGCPLVGTSGTCHAHRHRPKVIILLVDDPKWLHVISGWVESNQAPNRLVARKRDSNGKVMMTRRLSHQPGKRSASS
jgi:hypothetical protein